MNEEKETWRCITCKKIDLQIRSWVDLNTNEVQEACDEEELWCCNCEEFISFNDLEKQE